MIIDEVEPKAWYRSYANPSCQGTLINQTRYWPKETKDGEEVSSAYIDRMEAWDRSKFSEMVQMMGGKPGQQRGIDSLADRCDDETLLKAASHYFGKEVTAVRWVYYYNVSSGYSCERVDIVYKSA